MQVQRHIERVTSSRLVIDLPEAFLYREVEVIVLVVGDEKQRSTSSPNGDRVADLLAKISQNDGARCFGDPLEWQREVRTERFLLGRDEEWSCLIATP